MIINKLHIKIKLPFAYALAQAQTDNCMVAHDTLPYEQYFSGKARKTAKISISEGDTITYSSTKMTKYIVTELGFLNHI